MRHFKNIIPAVFLVLPVWGFAQEDDQTPFNQEIITIGTRELQLQDAFKPEFLPEEIDTVVEKQGIQYKTEPVSHKTTYLPDTIQAARLRIVEPLNKLQRFYIKAGMGSHTNALVDAYYNSLRSKNSQFGVALNHFSSNDGIKNVPSNGKFSDSRGKIWAKWFKRKHTLGLDVNGGWEVRHLFAFMPEDTPEKNIQNQYQRIGATFSLQSNKPAEELNYNGEVYYHSILEPNLISEHRFGINALFSKAKGNENFQLAAIIDHNIYAEDNLFTSTDNTLATLNPRVKTATEKLNVTVGLKMNIDAGTNKTLFSFFPDFFVSYSAWEQFFVPYAGIEGDVERNNFNTLQAQNPFIYRNLDLKNTREKLNGYFGIRGNLSGKTSYNLKASIIKRTDHAFFFKDSTSLVVGNNSFPTFYDDLNIFQFKGQFSYHVGSRFQLLATAIYRTLDTKKLENALNLPAIEGQLTGVCNLKNKLIITADIFTGIDRYGYNNQSPLNPEENEIKELDDYIDANLGIEYRYNKSISAFMQFNNILGKQYEQYSFYPVQGFTVLGGFTFGF